MFAEQVNPDPHSGRDFYSDPAAVANYIAYRDRGPSRNALVEQPAFLSLVGDVRGRDCLDLGCGYGYYSEIMAREGAKVTALDRAELMIAEAKARTKSEVEYLVGDMETADLPDDSYDIAISNLTFHYVEDLPTLFERVFRWLRPGGELVFSVEHPVYTATTDREQWCDEGDSRRRWAVSDYFDEGDRWGPFGLKYHHTTETWTNSALTVGFILKRIIEPQPSSDDFESMSTLVEDQHRPLYLIMACKKPEALG